MIETDKMVSAEVDHGVLGWMQMIIGATPVPSRIRFQCRDCGKVFDETTDIDVRKKHT